MMKKLLAVLLILVSACSFAQTRNLAGELNTVSIDSSANEVSIDSDDVASLREAHTDAWSSGAISSGSVVADVTATSIGALPAGTRIVLAHWKSDGAVGPVYYGAAGVTTDDGMIMPATTTLEIRVATTTPNLYFITTATATVRLLYLK